MLLLVLYGVFSTCTELVSSRAFFHKYTTKGSRGPEEHSQQSCIKYTYLSGNPKDDFLKKRKVSWCFLSSLLRYMIAEIALLLPSVMLHLLMMQAVNAREKTPKCAKKQHCTSFLNIIWKKNYRYSKSLIFNLKSQFQAVLLTTILGCIDLSIFCDGLDKKQPVTSTYVFCLSV